MTRADTIWLFRDLAGWARDHSMEVHSGIFVVAGFGDLPRMLASSRDLDGAAYRAQGISFDGTSVRRTCGRAAR